MPSSCILGPITWFHSSQKIAPIHSEAAGDGAAGMVGGGSGRTGEKGPNTKSCLFNCRWQGWWQHDHCVIMITPQRHLPPSSRLHSGSRYNLIHCAIGGADTIMQGIGTGVITVVCERRMKKARQKRGVKKDGVMMMGRPKLTIKNVNSDVSPTTPNSNSYSFNTSAAVYLPWLPVIILNMSFSSIHPFKGCWVWLQHYGDAQNQWCGGHLYNVGRALQWCVSRC